MDKTLEELKAEADVLGITYSKNIGADKLAQKIDDHYESLTAGDSVKVQPEAETEEVSKPVAGKKETPEEAMRRIVAKAKEDALKLVRVTVINNDPVESAVMQADYVGFENQYFGKSVLVPFNVECELYQGIINVLEQTPMTIHEDEYINGRRTGNKVPRVARKYSVSYARV